jgi:(1->4)-alpha-D-glucan 1-alpha-D-glucosylmutase
VENLLAKAAERIKARLRFPESTYRLQFHAGFTFRDATAILPYLHDLGITHCYASPYFKARPGSLHGYDIVDHTTLNPEIGSAEDYAAWVDAMHALGMGQILDMVPNHMGIVGNDNAWWNDVLENGPSSVFAGHFDIAWEDALRPELNNRVLLPFLGEPYGKALESGQIQLTYQDGSFSLHYFEHRFPVAAQSYPFILENSLQELEEALGPDSSNFHEYKSILKALSHLPGRNESDPQKAAEGQREKKVIKRRLAKLDEDCAAVKLFIERTVARINGRTGDSHSFDLLDKLLDLQAYRLSYWRVASDEINYRRFFDINELAALSMEKAEVFTATHDLVLKLLAQGKIDGLRIDHPDGLYDPKQYLKRLQHYYLLACCRDIYNANPANLETDWKQLETALLEKIEGAAWEGGPGPLYVVVEKILGAGEQLAFDWETHGTSGYEFVNAINGLFVDSAAAKLFAATYQAWTSLDTPYPQIAFENKYLILRAALSSELQMLARQLDRLAQKNRLSRDFTLNGIRFALRQMIAAFPVYRSYISDEGVHETDVKYGELATRRSIWRNPTINASLFRFVRDVLLQRHPEEMAESEKAEWRRFAGKFQQVTAPVMAKGIEDTTFYVYNRLLSLNEVGGDPSRFGVSADAVHHFNADRQAKWPWALSPLSTHDTKRSEDVRARLNVLSEMPEEWRGGLERWGRLNEPHRTTLEDSSVPDRNEEYFLYKTLIGAWPLAPCLPDEYARFVARIQAYMLKALHEAKVHSSWINPQDDYDQAVGQFVARILDEQLSAPFLNDIKQFQARVSHFGLLNSLAQTLLRICSPGAPDTYQGTELWDFSLVDPDNRRPVDYALRQKMLRELQKRTKAAGSDRTALARELIDTKEDGRIKLYLTSRALHCRRNDPGLFSAGVYRAGEPAGEKRDHLFAFVRQKNGASALVATPRLFCRLMNGSMGLPLGKDVWGDTRVTISALQSSDRWENVFTGQLVSPQQEHGHAIFFAHDLFAHFPVALLLTRP